MLLRKRLIIFAILQLLSSSGHLSAQQTAAADSVTIAKDFMRKKGSVESLYVGLYGRTSDQCMRFLFIASHSTAAEIVDMLKDSSSCIRLYAYAYIQSVFSDPLKKETKAFAKDSSAVFFLEGCMGGNTEVRYIIKRLHKWKKKGLISSWLKQFTDSDSKKNLLFFQNDGAKL